jgi:hypothetical protein
MVLVVLASACGSDATSPPSDSTSTTKPESDLHFVHSSDSTPALAQKTLTFYAVAGRDTVVHLWYHRRAGRSDSSEFLRFRVRSRSLVQRPDGTPIAEGDSLPITITVVDTVRLIVRFQPSGLVFAADDPARLTLKYVEADADLNDDGLVDPTDVMLKLQLGIWRQESDGAPWIRLPSSVSLEDSDEVEADVPGFTSYAIAY